MLNEFVTYNLLYLTPDVTAKPSSEVLNNKINIMSIPPFCKYSTHTLSIKRRERNHYVPAPIHFLIYIDLISELLFFCHL